MTIVLDANVLVSGIINPHGPSGRIVDLLRFGALSLVVDDRILSEYRDVLERPEIQELVTRKDYRYIVEYLERNSTHVLCTTFISDRPDHFDAPFLEAALESGSPIVTGYFKYFPEEKKRGTMVKSPSEFIAAWK